MYKSIISFFAFGALLFTGQACSGIEYDGEYAKDGTYESQNQVYFDINDASDTVYNYSFGTRPTTVTRDTVNVRVNLAGRTMSTPQHFIVSVDPSSSAQAGVHFVAIEQDQFIPADSIRMTLPVILLRQNLSETQNENIRLALRLEPTNELGTRYPDHNKVVITFDNVLEQPSWWNSQLLVSMGLGDYTPAKYRMLLSFYDNNPRNIERAMTSSREITQLYRNIQQIIDYFRANPE